MSTGLDRTCIVDGKTRTAGIACPTCQDTIRGHLDALPAYYIELELELMPGSVIQPDGSKRTKAPDAPLPCVEDPLNMRAPGGMVTFLADAENEVRDFFELTVPTFKGSVAQTVVGSQKFLLAHLGRMCTEWGNIDEFAKELRRVHNDCKRMLRADKRTFSPGKCPVILDPPEPDPDVDFDPAAEPPPPVECGRRLSVDTFSGTVVKCSRGHEYPAETWGLLGAELPDPRKVVSA